MTSEASGNTKASASLKARAFLFTLNQVDKFEQLLTQIKKLKSCDYYVAALEEAPTTGHEHIHMYVHFENLYKINQKIMMIGAHIDITRGTPQQCIEYVKKNKKILCEYGIEPHQGRPSSIKELRTLPIEEVHPMQYRTWKEINQQQHNEDVFMQMLSEIETDTLQGPKVIYITGPSGSGKTYNAYKHALSKYKKNEIGKLTINNNFIDVVNENALCYVIEEFRPSQIHAADFLQLTDKYGYRANCKGSFITLRPKTLIICSIFKPEELYIREEINEQFQRRITQTICLTQRE